MTPLSPRQREMLPLILSGKSRKEIAAEMGLAENTVRLHLTDIYERRCVGCRNELMAQLMQPTDEARCLIGDA